MSRKETKVHAEIEYVNNKGENIHSYICPDDCSSKHLDAEYRKLLHSCLDEWFNNAAGTGGFYVKEESYEIEKK